MIQLRPGPEPTTELGQLVKTLEDMEARLQRILDFCERITPLIARAERFAQRFGL